MAWKQWKEAITWIYAKSDGITLQHPLRPWLPKFDHDYEWNWLIHPTTQQLYHRIGDKWHVYHPLCHTTNFIEYPATPTIQNQIPDNTQPATPTLQPGCIQITAPIPMHHQPIPPQVPPTLTLLQWLQKPPAHWAPSIWHNITRHAPIGQLKQAILQKQPILLVSDASISARHTGTCAWAIWSTTHLWSREGIYPSTKDDLYSGLAEAYGIFTVLQFFQHYLSLFPIILPCSALIKLYCNSQSILDQSQTTTGSLYLHDTIQDDYPIFKEIQHLLQMLQPISVQLLHVTSHQDKKCLKRPLTTPKLLNVECDERATKLNNMIIESPVPHHLLLPSSYPHLQIDQQMLI